MDPTTEDFHLEVCKKFNTSPQQVRHDVVVLRTWMAQQPHLPQSVSDTLLATFLIACKNRMERAKEKIDNYYTARLEIPDFYRDRDPSSEPIQRVSNEIRLFTIPALTPDGCRVTMTSYVSGDITKFDISAFNKRLLAHVDVIVEQECFLMGHYFILDGNHFSMAHVLRLTPSLARDYMRCYQDVLPVRLKAVVIINAPTFIEMVINLLKPFMKGNLIEKFHVHSKGPEVLERYFPQNILPKDYGGQGDTSDELNGRWLKVLCQRRDWLLSEGSVMVDENKRALHTRPGALDYLQGSFKTLCVD